MSQSMPPPSVEATASIYTDRQSLVFQYRNVNAETSQRQAQMIYIWFGPMDLYPGEHWYMRALDLDTGMPFDFSMTDMTNVRLK